MINPLDYKDYKPCFWGRKNCTDFKNEIFEVLWCRRTPFPNFESKCYSPIFFIIQHRRQFLEFFLKKIEKKSEKKNEFFEKNLPIFSFFFLFWIHFPQLESNWQINLTCTFFEKFFKQFTFFYLNFWIQNRHMQLKSYFG